MKYATESPYDKEQNVWRIALGRPLAPVQPLSLYDRCVLCGRVRCLALSSLGAGVLREKRNFCDTGL